MTTTSVALVTFLCTFLFIVISLIYQDDRLERREKKSSKNEKREEHFSSIPNLGKTGW